MIRTLLPATLALSLAACGWLTRGDTPAVPIPSELAGVVSAREHIALAPDTQLRVRLEEVARGEAPPQFIAETTIPRIGQPPVRFRIAINPRVIDPKRSYTLTARIEREEQLLFISDPPVRVLTGGNPAWVEIVVQPAGSRK